MESFLASYWILHLIRPTQKINTSHVEFIDIGKECYVNIQFYKHGLSPGYTK